MRKPRIQDRVRIAPELRTARHETIRQLNHTHVGPVGRAILLKAVEFIPEIYNSAAHDALQHIACGIEFASARIGIDVDAGVTTGISPVIGVGAISDDFFSAGGSFFGSLVSFTDRLAGLLVQTMAFGEDKNGGWIEIDEEACLKRISEDEELRAKWERFFLYGAGIFFDLKESSPPLTHQQRAAIVQLTSAMEVFVLGHEYGHHVAQRSGETALPLAPWGSAFSNEYRADEIAIALSRFLGRCGFAGNITKYRNTWMESGAGAVAIIRAVQGVRYVREILQTGSYSENISSRPSVFDRLTAIENESGFAGEPLGGRFRDQRWFLGRLIPGICSSLKMRVCAAHQAGYRPTPAEKLRVSASSKGGEDALGAVDPGLVEIVAGDVLDATRSFGNADKSNKQEAVVPAIDKKISEDAVIARDLLRQYQERSIDKLAETALTNAAGIRDPRIAASIADKLRLGRIDGPTHHFELLVRGYANQIEQICTKLKLPLRGGVACGVLWNPGLDGPAQQSVLTTDASMVVIPESTLMLCHFLCKLLARSLPLKSVAGDTQVTLAAEAALANIRSNARLRDYAVGFLAYLATLDRRLTKPLGNAGGLARPVWRNLLLSTELFVIAHEYGHHIAMHGSDGSAAANGEPNLQSKINELEADRIAALIVAHYGAESHIAAAHSVASGVVALVGLDLLRRARSVLSTGHVRDINSDTHPTLDQRLLVFETLHYDPRNIEHGRSMRQNYRDILEGLWSLILPDLQAMHARGVRPTSK